MGTLFWDKDLRKTFRRWKCVGRVKNAKSRQSTWPITGQSSQSNGMRVMSGCRSVSTTLPHPSISIVRPILQSSKRNSHSSVW